MRCYGSVKKKNGELPVGWQVRGKREKVYFFFENGEKIYLENKKRDLFIFSIYSEIYFFFFRKKKIYLQYVCIPDQIYSILVNALRKLSILR
ncbi:MAG: hypothetical protein D3906_00360 [Candidatus Electrothrix sp. AUS1_2]|nr:hypothetical protein [Candidatus Electrothrix sp. AUS1_2]